ncbi:MAG: DUF481 domain-containing protein [Verrucomicrobia bacterium]|nr:DUF481 domain-containing protein [Verrucomicrobiota bacterium]
MYLRPASLLLTLLVSSVSLSGIELFLKNGDRLQGELIWESDDHLTIRHAILGEIEIAKSALAEMPSLEEIAQGAEKASAAGKKSSSKSGARTKTPDLEQSTDEQPEVAAMGGFTVTKIPKYIWNSPKELMEALERMNTKVGFSFADKASKRDQRDLRLFYNSRWKNGKSEYRFNTDYRFSETDGETDENRYTGNFRFRRQQMRNLFIQTSTFYRKDPIREINHWIEQGFGGGWNNKVSPSFEYSFGLEGSLKWEDLSEDNKAIGGYNFLTTLFQDSVYQIGKSYQVIQEVETYINPNNSENWGYRFDVMLDGKITNNFSLRLEYEYSFDNLVPKKVPQLETLFSSSLLYTF